MPVSNAAPALSSVRTAFVVAESSSPRAWLRCLARALGGAFLFGFVLRSVAESRVPGPLHLAWGAALAGTLVLAWAICLPALYILWASRQPRIRVAHCVDAATRALSTSALCLASTAPMLWFFSVTAPASRVPALLGVLFTALGLVSGGAAFGASLRESGGELPRRAQWPFIALTAATFVQFAHGAGLHWFAP